MYVAYSDKQIELQKELHDYFAKLIPPEVRDRIKGEGSHSEEARQIRRQMGADGWLGVGWPKEYGGRSLSALEQFIFYDEAQKAGAPLPFIALNTVGPTLMRFGTDEQRQKYLPGILKGELDFAIGYTEPNAGTDLASLQTRAVREGGEYIINGQKVFTSGGDVADYIWLAARTDPEAKKHRGISIFIVPTDSPGFSTQPLYTMGGGHTTFSFYEDVHVSAENLVLGENEGWKLITTQLNHERVGLAANSGAIMRLVSEVIDWARETKTTTGERVIDQPWVQLSLARAHAVLDAVKLHNWRMAAALQADSLTPGDASASKVLGTEAAQEAARILGEVVGQAGYLTAGSPGAELAGRVEAAYRGAIVGGFGGGSNEVQREIVAWTELGMPRRAR